MLRFFICCSLVLGTSALKAQFNKSPFSALVFQNDFEQAAFTALEKGDTSYLQIFMAARGDQDSLGYLKNCEVLDEIILELDSAKLMRKSPKRIVKKVFNTVHDRLLIKYELENQFVEIFETGYYNCVSASAIYSYCFEALGINHSVVEVPTHVYVIAQIEDETWVIESTDPQQGYYEVDEDSYEDYLEDLVEQKMITEEMLDHPKLDSILNDLFPSQFITTGRLTAFQYFNQAIYDYEEKKLQSAVENLIKANYLSAGIALSLEYILGEWLDQEDFDNPHYLDIFTLFLHLDTIPERASRTVNSYSYYGNKLLRNEISLDQFKAISDAFKKGLYYSDSAVKVVALNENLYFADYSINKRQYRDIYRYSYAALLVDSLNQSAAKGLAIAIGTNLDNYFWNAERASDTLKALFSRFPATAKNENLRGLMLFLQVEELLDQFESKNYLSSENAREQIESIEAYLEESETLILNPHRFGLIYSKYAHEIYKRQGKTKALAWIARGLESVPEHSVLLGLKEYYGNR